MADKAALQFGDGEDGEGKLTRDTLLTSLYSSFEIWRSDQNDLSTAVLIDIRKSLTHLDAPGPGCWWYWIRTVTPAGQRGEFSEAIEVCLGESLIEALLYIFDEAAPFGRRLFFRDANQFVEFDLAAMLSTIPDPQLTGVLGWGMIDNSFYLVGRRQMAVPGFDFLGEPIIANPSVPRYYLFRLNREPGVPYSGETPVPTFVKAVDWVEVEFGSTYTTIGEKLFGSLVLPGGSIIDVTDIVWPLTFPAHQSYVGFFLPFLTVDDDGELQVVVSVGITVFLAHPRPVPSGWAQVTSASARQWNYALIMRPDTGEILWEDNYVHAARSSDLEASASVRIIRWDLRTGGDRLIYVTHFSQKYRFPSLTQYERLVPGDPLPHIETAWAYGDIFVITPSPPVTFPTYAISTESFIGPEDALTAFSGFVWSGTSYYALFSVFSGGGSAVYVRDLRTNVDTLIASDPDGSLRISERLAFGPLFWGFSSPGLLLIQPDIAYALPDFGFDENYGEYFQVQTRLEEVHRIVTWPLTPDRVTELYGIANVFNPISIPDVPGAQPWTEEPDRVGTLAAIPDDLDVTPNDPPDAPLAIEIQAYHVVQSPGDGALP